MTSMNHSKHESHLTPGGFKMKFSSTGENDRKPSLICKKNNRINACVYISGTNHGRFKAFLM